MIINITGKQMEITPAIRQYAEERLAKLAKWQTQLINPHIILSKQPQGFVADATLSTPNGQLVASATHQDMYLAINELLAKLERQINKVQHKGEARRGMCQDREFYGGITPLAGGSTRERQRYPLDSAPSGRVLY